MAGVNILLLYVGVAVCVTGVELARASSQSNTAGKSDESRLQVVQEEFLNVIGNSSVSMKNVGDLMAVLHSQVGQQMGRLLLEGIMLGAGQKDRGTLISNFWIELQGRLSPELQENIKNYIDFFEGVDFSTLPIFWEQLFKKDELGNSLASMPLGQLVDMVQPTASRYGVNIKAFINSMMGKGENNARDLIFEALKYLDLTTLMSQLYNSSIGINEMLTTDTYHDPASRGRPKNEEKMKKGKGETTLRLFRPLVASLLRENNVDLDADAVLEVLSPLVSWEMMAQAAPLLAAFGSHAGDEMTPIIANILGGGEGKGKQQMGSFLGGLGALLAGGSKDKMDIGAMMNLASLFMDNSKTLVGNQKEPKRKDTNKPRGPDLASLASLAGKLTENGNIDINSLLETASNLLEPAGKKNTPISRKESKKLGTTTVNAQIPVQERMGSLVNLPQAKATSQEGKPRHLIDVVELILLTMQKNKQCNTKIKDAVIFGKELLNTRMSSVGDLTQLLPYIVSMTGSEFMSRKDLDAVITNVKKNFAHASWSDLFDSLRDEDSRERLVRSITPAAAEVVSLLASSDVQQRLYEAAVPKIQAFLSSYGLPGVTLDNFPERVAPVVGLMAKSWNLPFNPTPILVPLREYLKSVREWTSVGLATVRGLPSKLEVERVVMEALKDVCDGVTSVVDTRMAGVECLPQVLCQATQHLQPDSLRAAVTRTAGLIFASGPALEEPDLALLLKIVQALSGTVENCEENFSGDCLSRILNEEDDTMNLFYEHQELWGDQTTAAISNLDLIFDTINSFNISSSSLIMDAILSK